MFMVEQHKFISSGLITPSIIESSFIVIHRIWIFVGNTVIFLLGYNTRITNFLIPCFSHFLLFFLFTVLFEWMFAVEKYKLLLPRLAKVACTKLTYIFVMNSYGPFIFKSNARWNSETTSISVFCCACFLETLQFYIKVLLYEKTQRFVNRWNKTSNNELNFFDSRIGIITMISLLPLLQS